MKRKNIMAVCLLLGTFAAQAQTISTIAGNGTSGFSGDGTSATIAQLNSPAGVAVDGSGNVYIADQNNARIRKVNSSGIISTFAGTGIGLSTGDGGAATAADIGNPGGVATDGLGNVYIVDVTNHCVRKVNTSGTISTIAGTGTAGYNGDGINATTAQLNYPSNVAIDGSGNVYIADGNNHRIRKINSSGIISTFAGSGSSGLGNGGPATAAQLYIPFGVAVDGSGNVYISDVAAGNNLVRKVNTSGIINAFAGTGTSGFSGDGGAATAAEISPNGISVDGSSNVYIADGLGHIRKVNSAGIISSVAGNGTNGYIGDGMAATASELNNPNDVKVDGSGNLYIADFTNNRIRKVTLSSISAGVRQVTESNNEIVLLPNPNTGTFTIKGSLNSTADETVSLEIINMLGQAVYSKKIVAEKGSINIQMQLPGVANGSYLLKIVSETEKINYRFMIER